MRRHGTEHGHTVTEVVVAITVLAAGLLGVWGSLDQGVTFTERSKEHLDLRDEGRTAFSELRDELMEAHAATIDTSLRYALYGSYRYESDRFWIPRAGLFQCSSPACGFHTRPDLSVVSDHYRCGHVYQTGGSTTYVMGKHWPSSMTNCPLDGSPLNGSAQMDVLRYLSPRGTDGSYRIRPGTDGDPHYTTMVFLAPDRENDDFPVLKRFALSVDELLDPARLQVNGAWTRFDPNGPSWLDLLDFGTDGTGGGPADGSVPVVTADQDSWYESFWITEGQAAGNRIIYSKQTDYALAYPHMRVYLSLDLRTGRCIFDLEYIEALGTDWRSSGIINLPYEIIARDLTEFAASTLASNPHDPAANPTGVERSNTVRLTIGTTSRGESGGTIHYDHDVHTFVVSPRGR